MKCNTSSLHGLYLCNIWSNLVKPVWCQGVETPRTHENHWQITSLMTPKMIVHDKTSIILYILYYRQTSNIWYTLVGNKIVDHSDVVGASPVGSAPTTSSFLTSHLVSMDLANKTARQDENHLSFGIWCTLYYRFYSIQHDWHDFHVGSYLWCEVIK